MRIQILKGGDRPQSTLGPQGRSSSLLRGNLMKNQSRVWNTLTEEGGTESTLEIEFSMEETPNHQWGAFGIARSSWEGVRD
jgi:hypothetical protein